MLVLDLFSKLDLATEQFAGVIVDIFSSRGTPQQQYVQVINNLIAKSTDKEIRYQACKAQEIVRSFIFDNPEEFKLFRIRGYLPTGTCDYTVRMDDQKVFYKRRHVTENAYMIDPTSFLFVSATPVWTDIDANEVEVKPLDLVSLLNRTELSVFVPNDGQAQLIPAFALEYMRKKRQAENIAETVGLALDAVTLVVPVTTAVTASKWMRRAYKAVQYADKISSGVSISTSSIDPQQYPKLRLALDGIGAFAGIFSSLGESGVDYLKNRDKLVDYITKLENASEEARRYRRAAELAGNQNDVKLIDDVEQINRETKMELERVCKCNGPYCFVAGTVVMTDQGLRPIESITPGTRVLARGAQANSVRYATVKERTQSMTTRLVRIIVPTDTIFATPNHPFATKRGLILAEDLVKGDWIESLTPYLETAALGRIYRARGAIEVEDIAVSFVYADVYNLRLQGGSFFTVGYGQLTVSANCDWVSRVKNFAKQNLSNTTLQEQFVKDFVNRSQNDFLEFENKPELLNQWEIALRLSTNGNGWLKSSLRLDVKFLKQMLSYKQDSQLMNKISSLIQNSNPSMYELLKIDPSEPHLTLLGQRINTAEEFLWKIVYESSIVTCSVCGDGISVKGASIEKIDAIQVEAYMNWTVNFLKKYDLFSKTSNDNLLNKFTRWLLEYPGYGNSQELQMTIRMMSSSEFMPSGSIINIGLDFPAKPSQILNKKKFDFFMVNGKFIEFKNKKLPLSSDDIEQFIFGYIYNIYQSNKNNDKANLLGNIEYYFDLKKISPSLNQEEALSALRKEFSKVFDNKAELIYSVLGVEGMEKVFGSGINSANKLKLLAKSEVEEEVLTLYKFLNVK